MTSRVDLVVFDVGSVLVEAGRTLADDFAIAGYSLTPEWIAAYEVRVSAFPRPYLGAITIAAYAVMAAAASDGALSVDEMLRVMTGGFVREYPGIARVFDALEAAGVETALLSNVHDGEWARLFPDGGIAPDFPTLARAHHRFASHLIRARKPDPRAYLHVEEQTGRAPQEIVFFDDREENVVAARERGWTAELIDHRGDTAAQLMTWLRHHQVVA